MLMQVAVLLKQKLALVLGSILESAYTPPKYCVNLHISRIWLLSLN